MACLAIVDPHPGKAWMIDATPDFKDQLRQLESIGAENKTDLAGIFLTHAHIGHYTGLMHLGREAMGAKDVPVYAMPRMAAFLKNNGPWSQLAGLHNISLRNLSAGQPVVLNQRIKVVPLPVPHRDEFSETAGFKIQGPHYSLLYIPDINKWNRWDKDILNEIKSVDYALLDGTFFQNGEIPNRDMSQIPHPFIVESMALFAPLSPTEKNKVHFLHFNHTNPVLLENSSARKSVLKNGFGICREGDIFEL